MKPLDLARFRARLDEALCPTPCPEAIAELFAEMAIALTSMQGELERLRRHAAGRLAATVELAREACAN